MGLFSWNNATWKDIGFNALLGNPFGLAQAGKKIGDWVNNGGIQQAWNDYTGLTDTQATNEMNYRMFRENLEYQDPVNQMQRLIAAGVSPHAAASAISGGYSGQPFSVSSAGEGYGMRGLERFGSSALSLISTALGNRRAKAALRMQARTAETDIHNKNLQNNILETKLQQEREKLKGLRYLYGTEDFESQIVKDTIALGHKPWQSGPHQIDLISHETPKSPYSRSLDLRNLIDALRWASGNISLDETAQLSEARDRWRSPSGNTYYSQFVSDLMQQMQDKIGLTEAQLKDIEQTLRISEPAALSADRLIEHGIGKRGISYIETIVNYLLTKLFK